MDETVKRVLARAIQFWSGCVLSFFLSLLLAIAHRPVFQLATKRRLRRFIASGTKFTHDTRNLDANEISHVPVRVTDWCALVSPFDQRPHKNKLNDQHRLSYIHIYIYMINYCVLDHMYYRLHTIIDIDHLFAESPRDVCIKEAQRAFDLSTRRK